jgi:hypothetical protein
MKKNNNTTHREMFEFNNLIEKEKEGALQSFREEDFRSRLSRRIDEELKTLIPSVFWFRKPIIVAGIVLLLVVMVWIAAQIFTPSPYERDARAIEKTLARVFEAHELLIGRSIPQIEPQRGPDNVYEFEWSLKRVIYSIQREDIPDSDIPRIFSQAILNATRVRETEDNGPSGLNTEREDGFLWKENNFQRSFLQD